MRERLVKFTSFLLALWLALCVAVGAACESVYVLGQPYSFVYVRETPKRGGRVCGYLDLGMELQAEGTVRNGFLRLEDGYFESAEAWVNLWFISRTPVVVETVEGWIESTWRVACRRSVNGTRRKWLADGQEVVIYARGDDWAVTDQGFIKTAFLGGF